MRASSSEAEQWMVIVSLKVVDCDIDIDGIDGGGLFLLKFRNSGGEFGAGVDFLDPSRVESIDKRLILCLASMSNR